MGSVLKPTTRAIPRRFRTVCGPVQPFVRTALMPKRTLDVMLG